MRVTQELSSRWLFSKTASEAPEVFPLGAGWEPVTLPHTWNATDGQLGHAYDRGAYWYVTTFEAPRQPTGDGRTYIEVGAAALRGEIWVNGVKATEHVGGYSAFRADVTELCHPGENVLAILCDNRYSDKVYPQRADFIFYGGLYRYVRVISVPESHFSLDDHGGCGVYVDAKPVGEGAAIDVRALVSLQRKDLTVSLTVLDETGAQAAECWDLAEETTHLNCRLTEARKWNGTDGPHLYTALLRLVSFNEVIDEVRTTFGIRSFALDRERGFILNGKPCALRGVCRHQDRLYLGNALSQEHHDEDAALIAEMGANCVRLAHYQQSAEMYDACDRLGLVVWAEIPYFAQSWDDDAHASAVEEIRELCVQNYNHPSICFWGLSNEILMGGNDNPKLLDCHRDLNRAVKEIDPERITVIAHEYNAAWDHPLHELSDAEGWNHYFGWYRGDMEDLGRWADKYHAAYPDRCFAVTEYGCDGIIRYHSDDPVKMDYTEEYQARLHDSACADFASRPWIWGTFVWNMFDFGSFFRREGGTEGRNNKGLVTMDRKIKKDAFYVYKAWYSREPFVHLDGRRYFARPGRTATVTVRSNLPEVSLYVDGKLFQTKTGEHTFIFEQVPIAPEGTAVMARAGCSEDTMMIRAAETKPDIFTFPEFRHAQDAKNWFEGVEDIAGEMVSVPGAFSVHSSMEDVIRCPEAKRVVLDCLVAVSQRILQEDRVFSGNQDMNMSVIDFMSQGMAAEMLGNKSEQAIRRLHSALSKIQKQP